MASNDAATRASHESTGFVGTLRRIWTGAPVRILVVAVVVVVGLTGPGLADETPAADGGTTSPGSDVVALTCSGVHVDVPADRTYYLHAHLLDTSTGQQFRAVVGPFTGPLDERTDGTGLRITAVEVLYENGGGAAASLTERC